MKILILGDSHSMVMGNLKDGNEYVSSFAFGATAYGLLNKDSISAANEKFTDAVLNKSEGIDFAMILVGEVDCNFHIWWRSIVSSTSIDEIFEKTIENYTKFLETTLESKIGKERIVVIGPQLPKIVDYMALESKGRLIPTSLSERTELTKRFCRRLEMECVSRGYLYFDTIDETIDPSTGCLSEPLLMSNKENIHIDQRFMLPIYARKVASIVDKIKSRTLE